MNQITQAAETLAAFLQQHTGGNWMTDSKSVKNYLERPVERIVDTKMVYTAVPSKLVYLRGIKTYIRVYFDERVGKYRVTR